jgi:hypothetical protein
MNIALKTLSLLVWLLFSCTAFALELGDVMDQVRVEPPGRVAFREERFNPLLQDPLVLTGFLEYPEPGHLVKLVETPFHESMQVDGDEVEISRDGKKRRLSLKNRKPMLIMLQSIESILSGQADALAEHFETELTGCVDDWQLQLTPRSKRLARHLQGMTVKGDGTSVGSILFQMDNGDWQRLEILPPAPEP